MAVREEQGGDRLVAQVLARKGQRRRRQPGREDARGARQARQAEVARAAVARRDWQIVVPDNGLPLAGGAVPTLIQWSGPHPTSAMPDSGVRLVQLTVRGMPDQTAQVLRLRPLRREPLPGAALSLTLATPQGEVSLSSHVPA